MDKWKFLEDKPLENKQSLKFGHTQIAEALFNIVSKCHAPFTIGLFGGWGTGKSSILNAAQEQLGTDVPMVIFDVWKYEQDDPRTSFMKFLIKELRGKGEQLRKQLKKEVDLIPGFEENDRLGRARTKAIRTKIGMIGFDEVIKSIKRNPGNWVLGVFSILAVEAGIIHFFPGMMEYVYIIDANVIFTSGVVLWLSNKLVYTVPITIRESPIYMPDEFEEEFGKLLSMLLPKYKRICIAFDNLDRVSDENAIVMLSLIKNFLEPQDRKNVTKEVVFVVACDSEAMKEQIKKRYPDDEKDDCSHNFGEEFLRKFFNTTLHVPEFIDLELEDYTIGLLKETNVSALDSHELAQMITTVYRQNPRQMKQFINSMVTYLLVAESVNSTGDTVGGELLNDHIGVGLYLIFREKLPRVLSKMKDRGLERFSQELNLAEEFSKPDLTPWEIETIVSLQNNFAEMSKNTLTTYERIRLSDSERELPGSDNALVALKDGKTESFVIIAQSNDYEHKAGAFARLMRQTLQETKSRAIKRVMLKTLLEAMEDLEMKPNPHLRATLAEQIGIHFQTEILDLPTNAVFKIVLFPLPIPPRGKVNYRQIISAYVGGLQNTTDEYIALDVLEHLIEMDDNLRESDLAAIGTNVSGKWAADLNILGTATAHDYLLVHVSTNAFKVYLETLKETKKWAYLDGKETVQHAVTYAFQPLMNLKNKAPDRWTFDLLQMFIQTISVVYKELSNIPDNKEEFLAETSKCTINLLQNQQSISGEIIGQINSLITRELSLAVTPMPFNDQAPLVSFGTWLQGIEGVNGRLINPNNGVDIGHNFIQKSDIPALTALLDFDERVTPRLFSDTYLGSFKTRAMSSSDAWNVIIPHCPEEQKPDWFSIYTQQHVEWALDFANDKSNKKLIAAYDPAPAFLTKLNSTTEQPDQFEIALKGCLKFLRDYEENQKPIVHDLVITVLTDARVHIQKSGVGVLEAASSFKQSDWREFLKKLIEKLIALPLNQEYCPSAFEVIIRKWDLLSKQGAIQDQFVQFLFSRVVSKAIERNAFPEAKHGLEMLLGVKESAINSEEYLEDTSIQINRISDETTKKDLLNLLVQINGKGKTREQ